MTKGNPTTPPNKKHQVISKDKETTDEIPIEIAEVIKDLPEEKKQTLIKAWSVKKHYSGPLPDGESIKIYDEVIPNGGDRLMSTVEKQLDHRIEIEKTGVKRSFNQSSTGQWMGFLLLLFLAL